MTIGYWYFPRLLQIGSTGRNSGKTTVAKKLIEKFNDYPLVALKIITITGKRGVCQRGGVGCGICTSIDSGFELIEEKNRRGKKDTMELLKAGVEQSFLLKAFEDSLFEGFEYFLEQIPANALIICESNSLRKYVEPGVFIMMDNQKRRLKPSSKDVYDFADLIVSDATDPAVERITIQKETTTGQLRWDKQMPVTVY